MPEPGSTAAEVASGEVPAGERSWPRPLTIAYAAAVALLVGAVLWAGVRAQLNGWIPTGDNAFLAMRSRAVFSSHAPLLSSASSAGADAASTYNHPGPSMLYLISPVTFTLGSAWTAMAVAMVNAAVVAVIAVLARAAARPLLAAAVLAATGGLVAAMGSALLVDPWNPHFATLMLLAALVATWSVWCGVRWAVPAAIVAAALAGQTHLSFAGVAVLSAVLALAAVIVRVMRSDGPERTSWLRWAAGGLVGGLVAMAPTIIEQVSNGSDGNLVRILRGGDTDAVTVSAGQSLSVGARAFMVPPFLQRWSWPVSGLGDDLPSRPTTALLLLIVAIVSGLSLWWAVRRSDRSVLSLIWLPLAVAAFGTVISWSFPLRLGVPIPYFRWLWPAAALWSAAIAAPAVEWVLRRWAPRQAVTAGTGVFVALAIVAAVATVAPHNAALAGSSPEGQEMSRELFAQFPDDTRYLGTVEVIASPQEGPLMSFTPALMDHLDELGVVVRSSDPVLVQQSGEHHRATGDEEWVITMVGPDTGAAAGPAGGRRLAVHDALDPDERAALERDLASSEAQLTGATVQLTPKGVASGDADLQRLTELRDQPQVLARERLLPTAIRNGFVTITPAAGTTIDPEFVADVAERAFTTDGRTFAVWLVPRKEWHPDD